MARKKIIAGNWKMNMTPSQAVELINTLKPLVANDEVDVLLCVPAIDIIPAMEAAKGSNIMIGAENMYFEEKGAFTGEISPAMLDDAGVKYVIIGHSERREYFAETDETVNKKVLKAFEHGITPIICCGETLTQREQGVTIDFIRQQIKIAFLNVTAAQAATAVIAYEPIWAIGTGKVATTEQAQEVCKAIRECIAEIYDDATAAAIRIQYGGSVSASSAPELFAQADIDGGLVGGASLKADFGQIVCYGKSGTSDKSENRAFSITSNILEAGDSDLTYSQCNFCIVLNTFVRKCRVCCCRHFCRNLLPYYQGGNTWEKQQ